MNNIIIFRSWATDVMRLFATLIGLLWFGVLMIHADTHYVSLDGANESPYTNGWASAAHEIQSAVNNAITNDTVLVSNGTYNLTNQINILTNITVRSLYGTNSISTSSIINGNYPAYRLGDDGFELPIGVWPLAPPRLVTQALDQVKRKGWEARPISELSMGWLIRLPQEASVLEFYLGYSRGTEKDKPIRYEARVNGRRVFDEQVVGGSWQKRGVDLSEWKGQTILLSFIMDSRDAGWGSFGMLADGRIVPK